MVGIATERSSPCRSHPMMAGRAHPSRTYRSHPMVAVRRASSIFEERAVTSTKQQGTEVTVPWREATGSPIRASLAPSCLRLRSATSHPNRQANSWSVSSHYPSCPGKDDPHRHSKRGCGNQCSAKIATAYCGPPLHARPGHREGRFFTVTHL